MPKGPSAKQVKYLRDLLATDVFTDKIRQDTEDYLASEKVTQKDVDSLIKKAYETNRKHGAWPPSVKAKNRITLFDARGNLVNPDDIPKKPKLEVYRAPKSPHPPGRIAYDS